MVDRDALLTFIQYRSKAFELSLAAQRLDGMTTKEREQLTRDFIREEALYREASTLGMTDNDYVIRRRTVPYRSWSLSLKARRLSPRPWTKQA